MKSKKKILYPLMILAIWFFLHTIIIIIDGLSNSNGNCDLAVVLGNKVEKNGQPSTRLKSRLDKAFEIFKKGGTKYLLMSGGVGKEGFDEAKVMKNYLVKKGINKKKIFVDSKGNNSYMTAKNTKKLLNKNLFKNVMIISHYYHISRTKLAFKKVGIDNVFHHHANIDIELREPFSIFREFVGYYVYLAKY